MKRLTPLFLLLALLSGCTPKAEPATQQFFAMDTVMSVTAYGNGAEETVSAAQREVFRLEALWSRTRTESDIARLNAHAGDGTPVPLAPETAALLRFSSTLGTLTGGALDITIAPVMDAWGFGSADSFDESSCRVPTPEELDRLLPLAELDGLSVSDIDQSAPSAALSAPGMAVDLGAVAKGETGSLLRQLLLDAGIRSAKLELGGNITVLGDRPDGAQWRVGVRDPRNLESYFCILSLTDKTCSTSGGYERYFEEGGETYHHILDPSTGYPAESGLLSVTAVSTDGALADGLSTACFVMGADRAAAFWRTHGGPEGMDFDLILVRDDGVALITEGLEDGLDFQGEETGYTYEILRR